ncbi:MAG: hypothetical protein ACRD6X_15040 [Pyrinomonadaceae bacterium]
MNKFKIIFPMCIVLVVALNAIAQDAAQVDKSIPRNSKVFIAPVDGFETYMAAAIAKKKVPLIIVTDRDAADFEIIGTAEKKSAGWAKVIFLGDIRGSASASMQVVNLKTKVVVYADSSDRSSANRGHKSTAEKLAKYLKEKIEKG